MKRIGLFGGTFNPVHLGHIQVALEVCAALGLDHVVLIPSALPPHKPAIDLAPGPERLAMIRLAVADHPVLRVSGMELQRPGPSYSVDTIAAFQQQAGPGHRFFFLVGLDAFLEMDGWHRYRDIFKAIDIVVIPRPQSRSDADWSGPVEAFLRQSLCPAFQRQKAPDGFAAPGFAPILLAAVAPVDICATRIRERVRRGCSIATLVHPAVEHYIQQKGLYR